VGKIRTTQQINIFRTIKRKIRRGTDIVLAHMGRRKRPRYFTSMGNDRRRKTLDKAIRISQNFEYCRQQMSLINQKDVHLISSRDKGHLRGGRRGRERDRYPAQREVQQKADQDQPSYRRAQQTAPNRGNGRDRRCERCGNPPHKERTQCPAWGKTCNRCHKKKHWRRMCKLKYVYDVDNSDSENTQDDDSCDSWIQPYSIDTVSQPQSSTHSSAPNKAFVNVSIGPNLQNIQFKIDTGSSVNTISQKHFESLNIKAPLKAPDTRLTSYSGDNIHVFGKINLKCK